MPNKQQQSQTWPFVGHAELGRHLIRLADSDRLPRVLLFVGPRAVGKGSAAQWLLQRQLCSASADKPCGICRDCRQALDRVHPDGVCIDPPGSTSIGIEEIRVALQHYQLVSWEQTTRWLVLLDAERLTEAASNTMLKFLEELPSHVNVIMTTSEPQRLLPTLQSRATVYQWHLVAVNDMPRTTTDHHRLVSRSAGRPGWLHDLQESGATLSDAEQAKTVADAFLHPRAGHRLPPKDRIGMDTALHQEELVLRDLLLSSIGSHRRLLWPSTWSIQNSQSATLLQAVKKYLARYELSYNLQPRLLYEDLHLV